MKRIVTLALCLILGAVCLTGCTNDQEAFKQKSYTTQGQKITEVSIDVRDRQIEVIPSFDSQVHIDYFENSKEYYDISVTGNNRLTMTSASNKEWTDYVGEKSAVDSRKIILQLPNEILTEMKLCTTNEDILLSPLNVVENISLSSQGGNIVFDKLKSGRTINLNGKNGNISGSIIGGYDDFAISCDIKKGESNLPPNKEEGGKTLTALNNNGNINIEFVKE